MTNGFYNTDGIIDDKIRLMFKQSINSSYNVQVQVLQGSISREQDMTRSIEKAIDEIFSNDNKMFTVIDRSVRGIALSNYGEVCLSANLHNRQGSLFVYCFMNLQEFSIFIERYNLTLKEF